MGLNSCLDVISKGEGSVTLVALHGIQGTRDSWLPVAERVHSNVRWVLPNMRGRGKTIRGTCQSDYTLEAYASDVVQIIEQHVITNEYVLLGWSMGVSVALETHRQLQESHGKMPNALVLMSGSPVLAKTHWFRSLEHHALLVEIANREKRLGLKEAADWKAVAWTWQAIRRTDQRHLLSKIDVPTLIIHGSDDEDSPWEHTQMLRHSLADARLKTINGGKHNILAQNSNAVSEEIDSFLSTIFANKYSNSTLCKKQPTETQAERTTVRNQS